MIKVLQKAKLSPDLSHVGFIGVAVLRGCRYDLAVLAPY